MQKNISLLGILSLLSIVLVQNIQAIVVLENNDSLEITVLDVGQGDSMLIKTPQNSYALIDTGRKNTSSEKLKDNLPSGVTRLSFVLLTHPDADHIEDMLTLIDSYEIDTLFLAPTRKDSPLYKEIIKKVVNTNTKVITPVVNDYIIVDDVRLDIIWPEIPIIYSDAESNDTSISFKLSYNDFSLVSFGDLSARFELEALNYINEKDIDVLKISHHGSKSSTSSELLDSLLPEITILSYEEGNQYGHPHSIISDYLEDYDRDTLYSTAENGDITIKVMKNDYKVF